MSIYDYSVPSVDGQDIEMSDFKGKVLLIVNTATACGFTPQYKDIVAIYEQFHEQGLEVIDIPCNQFANEAPGSDEEIREFCTLNYNTPFVQMKKSDVNGEQALPLYRFLKEQQGFSGLGRTFRGLLLRPVLRFMDKNYQTNADIKWNFTKFIVDREGHVVARFEPTQDMKDVEACIAGLI